MNDRVLNDQRLQTTGDLRQVKESEDNFEEILKLEQVYDLPKICYEESVSSKFIEEYKNSYSFVTVVVSNSKGQILFIRDFSKNIGWELPSSFIQEEENLLEAVNRTVRKEAGFLVDQVEPIAFVDNVFKGENSEILHKGVAFQAVVRGEIGQKEESMRKTFLDGRPNNLAYQNDRILDIADINLKDLSNMPVDEIESGREKYLQHVLHQQIVNRLFGRKSSEKLRRKIMEVIEVDPNEVVDIACGDDDLIFDIQDKLNPEICIANDISWATMSLLNQKKESDNVIFTNHDLKEFPFGKNFDLLILKNTLHHIPGRKQEEVIRQLERNSEQLIVMDINNPREDSLKSMVWNFYYRKFLGDQGEDFLNYQEFRDTINGATEGKKEYGKVQTSKGSYMFASIM